MRKRKAVTLALFLLIFTFICGSLNICAESNSSFVIEEDFAAQSDCIFLAPGDMDADGKANTDDLVIFKQLLLSNKTDTSYTAVYNSNGENAKYSDINGDGFVNVKDLVCMKKNLAENFVFVHDGVMSLNGNSALNGIFNSALSKDASYAVSLTYKSDYPVRVKMADLGVEFVFEPSSTVSTLTKTFKTPAAIGETKGIQFQVIGVATIDEISVIRVNMDNDIADNW